VELGKSYGIVVLSISTIFVLLLGLVPLTAYAGSINSQEPEFALKCYITSSSELVIAPQPTIDPPAVQLVDQFGSENVDPDPGPQLVCEEALKHSEVAPIDPRHWTLYLFNDGTKDFGTKVLTDQFGTETLTGTLSSILLTPATKNGQSPPNAQHWTSYNLLDGQINPGPVLVADQFGTSTLNLSTPLFFLTNTFKNNEGDPNGPDLKCYFIAGETPIPVDPAQHEYVDQFGTTSIDPSPAALLCVMAVKSSPTVVGGELIGIDTTAILLAGTQYTAAWMIPVIVSAIGIGIVIARKF